MSAVDEVFGDLVLPEQIEEPAKETLRVWLPHYSSWVEKKAGMCPGDLPVPAIWTASSFSRLPDGRDGQPSAWDDGALLALTAARFTDTEVTEDGVVDGWVELVVAAGAVGSGVDDARRTAGRIATAAMAILIQKFELLDGGPDVPTIDGVRIARDRTPEDDRRSNRSAWTFQIDFHVKGLMAQVPGPTDPGGPPFTDPQTDPLAEGWRVDLDPE